MSGQMGNTLLVTGVGREDKGMYQCMVRRQEGDTFQAVAELQLGGKWRQDVACVCEFARILKLDLPTTIAESFKRTSERKTCT